MSALPRELAVQQAAEDDRQDALRILCLNYEYPPMGGGAGNATHHTAVALAARGHLVHVLTARLPEQPAVESVQRVVVHRVRSFRRGMLDCGLFGAVSYLLFAFAELMRLSRRYEYDLYQFYFGAPTGLLALYVHLVLGKPYVLALRGSDVPGYDDTRWYMRPLHWLLRPLTRYLWRNAAGVTVLSRGLAKLAQRTCPEVEGVLITNGVDADAFPAKPAKPAAARTPAPERLRLLTVCRMVPRKGLHFLIEAMCELRKDGIELDVVGDGEAWRSVDRLVREHALEDCVSLLGYMPRDQLYHYYHQADIFVLPSLSESFGQVLLEAMSCGLPVVATTVGGIPETIHHERNGLLIPPADPAALVEAVRRLASDPALREAIGEHNARQVRERYSWSAVARQYESLYQRLLGRQAARVGLIEPWVQRGKSG